MRTTWKIVSIVLVGVLGLGSIFVLFNQNPPSGKRSSHSINPRDATSKLDSSTNRNYLSLKARVTRIYDGDSFEVRVLKSGRLVEIRTRGIDCPETSPDIQKCGPGGVVDLPCEEQVPLGRRARSFARSRLLDRVVKLESYKEFKRDEYDRLLAYVRTPNGRDYGLLTVKEGYCNDSGKIFDHPRDETYRQYRRPLAR